MSAGERRLNPAQRGAVEISGRDLLVSAGAGTGKTTVLIERVLHRLRHRPEAKLEALLIVTFTEKAAQEMKDRLSAEITRDPALRPQLVQLPRAYLSTLHAFCARLLREHFLEAECEPSFRILDQYGRTEALEEALRRAFHAWYQLDDGDRRGTFISLVEMAGYDEEGEILKKVVGRLYDYARTTNDPEEYLAGVLARAAAPTLEGQPWYPAMVRLLTGSPEAEGAWQRGLRFYRGAIALAQESGGSAGKMEAFRQAMAEAGAGGSLADPAGQAAAVEALTRDHWVVPAPGLKFKYPNAPRGANDLPGFKALHDAAKEAWSHFTVKSLPWKPDLLLREAGAQRQRLEVLASLVREADAWYTMYKRRNGLLDFSDLEIKAARLLRLHGAGLGLDRKFDEVLVDEFQDINPLQDEILSHLGPPSGRFRVGDVKQAIYQFRLADPGIFLGLARGRPQARFSPQGSLLAEEAGGQAGGSGAKSPGTTAAETAAGTADTVAFTAATDTAAAGSPLLIVLEENHRSLPPILRLANHVLGRIFRSADIGSDYAAQALVAARPAEEPEVPVELHLLEKMKKEDTEGTEEPPAGPVANLVSNPPADPAADPAAEQECDNPAWTPVQTEAYYTARRLARLIREERPRIRVSAEETREARWGDVAILLRTHTHLDTFLEALERAGIPAYRGAGGSLLAEDLVRDFRCLLSVIDNPRDDVALAALLRSPLFRVGDADLLRTRLARPQSRDFLDAVAAAAFGDDLAAGAGSFWPVEADPAAVAEWTGPAAEDEEALLSPTLRRTLREILERIRDWRVRQGETELVRFLTALRTEAGIDASLAGRDDPAHERASLEKFIALARGFEEERGPSLHGFLSRLDTLESAEGITAVPAVAGEENAVSLLTIHGAKGLEFPIVVLPQLAGGSRRNPLDGKVRIGREWLGISLLDYDTWGRRDTAARRTLAEIEDARGRAEEARILYVALTRAKERLILIGSPKSSWWREPVPANPEGATLVREERLHRGANVLEWILATLPWGEEQPRPPRECATVSAFPDISLELAVLPAARAAVELQQWLREIEPEETPAPRLPDEAPPEPLSPAILRELARIGRLPSFPAWDSLEDLKGKYWVTELKSLADAVRKEDLSEEGSGLLVPAVAGETARAGADAGIQPAAASAGAGAEAAATSSGETAEAAARRGLIYHAALSRLDLSQTQPAALQRQFAGFAAASWWQELPRDAQMERGITRFFDSELGRSLSSCAAADPKKVEREVAFSCRWPVTRLIPWLPGLARALETDPRWRRRAWRAALEEEWVLLQGRIDCLFSGPAGWALLDWKTDRVPAEGPDERVAAYTPQLQLYRDAVERLWGPVAGCWLVFLRTGAAVEVPAAEAK